MNRWTARNEINELARQQVVKLLDDALNAPQGSLARKVADFRAAYLNHAAIESKGIQPLAPLLDSITLLRDKAGLVRYLGRGVVADVDPLNWGLYRSSHVLGLGRAGHPGRADTRSLPAPGRAWPARPRALPEPRAGDGVTQGQVPNSTSPGCWHWPDSDM